MVKIFIYSLLTIVLALAVTLYLDLPNDPGYLYIAWRNYTFETSLFALIVLFILLLFIIRLLRFLLSWFNPWHLVRYGRRYKEILHSRSRSLTVEGLMHFARYNWEGAYKVLVRSFKEEEATVINYLAAAYAAYAMHRKDLWLECLDSATSKFPGTLSTINAMKAELLYRTDHLEQSLAVLEQLKKNSINDRHLLSLMKDVCIRLGDWSRLRALQPALKKAGVFDEMELDEIDKRLFAEELNQLSEEVKKNNKSRASNLTALEKHWRSGQQKYRNDDNLVHHYVELLLDIKALAEAAATIESQLSRAWDNKLVQLYGEYDFPDPPRQLARAEDWLRERPNNDRLLLALGRISLRNKLWGKAREYFETSLRIKSSAEAFGELSRLTRALGDHAASENYFAQYSEMVGQKLPELPQPDVPEKKAI